MHPPESGEASGRVRSLERGVGLAKMQSPSDAATCSNNLKGEDRARSAVADICGETVELFMVADGHGGAEVADLCAEHAFTYLVREATATGDGSAASLEAALARTFEHLHTSAIAKYESAGPAAPVENVASPLGMAQLAPLMARRVGPRPLIHDFLYLVRLILQARRSRSLPGTHRGAK